MFLSEIKRTIILQGFVHEQFLIFPGVIVRIECISRETDQIVSQFHDPPQLQATEAQNDNPLCLDSFKLLGLPSITRCRLTPVVLSLEMIPSLIHSRRNLLNF